MPTFSILIPVFNRQKYISHCIQSALDQTFPDLEVVVVDNASDDGTWEICQQFAATDSRVRIFRNESNVGPVRNWKRCINESNAPFGKLLFSDDLLEPDFLKKTLPYLQNPEVGFVFSSARCGENPEDGRIINRYTKKSGVYKNIDFIIKSLFWGDTPHSPGCAIFRTKDLQKNLVLDIPSPTIKDFLTHGAGPDLLLYLLTAKNYPCFAFVDEPLCFFRAHEGSITTSDKNRYLFKCYIQARIWFVENYSNFDKKNKFYMNIWYEYCRNTNDWTTPKNFFRAYTSSNHTNSWHTIIKYINSKILEKIKRLLTKNRQSK